METELVFWKTFPRTVAAGIDGRTPFWLPDSSQAEGDGALF
jgi:hypothetical protein